MTGKKSMCCAKTFIKRNFYEKWKSNLYMLIITCDF